MKAVCWHSANDVRVDTVPDPQILNPHDLRLDEAPHGYDIFKHKQAGCIKVVLKP